MRYGGHSLNDLPRPGLRLLIKHVKALQDTSLRAAFMRFEVASGKPFPSDADPVRAGVQARSRRRTRLRGEDSLSDLPRPDRLGLVMKYLWALKGSSPSAALTRVEVPSGNSFQLCSLSLKFATMIWSSTCSCTVGLRIGHKTSTRRSRLRGITSADEI